MGRRQSNRSQRIPGVTTPVPYREVLGYDSIMRRTTIGQVFYVGLYLGFLCGLYLESTNFVVGMLAAVALLVVALPLELVLSQRGLISWRATFSSNSKMRKALVVAPLILIAIVGFGRPPSTAPT